MTQDIYLSADLVHTGNMTAIVQAGELRAVGDEGSGLIGRLLLCELALTVTVFATPAHGQSMQRAELIGFVEARCSAVTPAGLANFEGDEDVISRALTVRCSGQTPALSVRTRSPDDPEVTLTVASEHGSQTGQRLSTREGNVVVDLADVRRIRRRVERQRGPVEIIVAPAL